MNDTRTLLAYPPEEASEVRDTLEGHGHEVTVTHSATQALAKVVSEPFECVVSAYALPGDDGLSLFEGVCEIDDEIPFILFDDVQSLEMEEAFNTGIDRFIHRNGSESADTLAEKITEVTIESLECPEKQDISGHEPEPSDVLRAIDEAPVGMTITDPSLPDNPVVYLNDAWEDVTGYDEDDVLGRNLRMLQGPETDPESIKTLADAVANERTATVELKNYRRDGTPFWNELTIAPICEDGEMTHYVGFQNDVTQRKEAEQLAAERAARLTEQKEALSRILRRVNGLLHNLTNTLIEQNERPIVSQRICDEIADADGFAASWIGSTGPTDDVVRFDATAGFADEELTELSLEALPDPVGDAIDSNRIAVCTTGTCNVDYLGPDDMGIRRFAVVPLVYDGTRYGLLGVYADSPDLLDRREQQLFESIGKMIASRLNAIETAEILVADRVVRVQIAIRDESFPTSTIATQLDATVEYVGLTDGGDGTGYELFLTASNCENIATLSELSTVDDVRVISDTGDACTFSVGLDSPVPFHGLADHGASVARLTAESGQSILELELPPEHDVRSIVEVLERNYDRVELRSRQERQRREQTTHEFNSQIHERLTDRQQATLEAAHMNGYFEWPRPTDGSEIAETMGVTRQTFHQHLRAAEQKLIETYIEFYADDTNGTPFESSTLDAGRSSP